MKLPLLRKWFKSAVVLPVTQNTALSQWNNSIFIHCGPAQWKPAMYWKISQGRLRLIINIKLSMHIIQQKGPEQQAKWFWFVTWALQVNESLPTWSGLCCCGQYHFHDLDYEFDRMCWWYSYAGFSQSVFLTLWRSLRAAGNDLWLESSLKTPGPIVVWLQYFTMTCWKPLRSQVTISAVWFGNPSSHTHTSSFNTKG